MSSGVSVSLFGDFNFGTLFDFGEDDIGNTVREADATVAGGVAFDVFTPVHADTGAGQTHPVFE